MNNDTLTLLDEYKKTLNAMMYKREGKVWISDGEHKDVLELLESKAEEAKQVKL